MPNPVDNRAHDTQGLGAAEGVRRVPRELLVGQARVVLEGACRLDDVDAPAPLAGGQLGALDGGIERRRELDVAHYPALLEVRQAAGDEQVACGEVGLGVMEVDAGIVGLERHRYL